MGFGKGVGFTPIAVVIRMATYIAKKAAGTTKTVTATTTYTASGP